MKSPFALPSQNTIAHIIIVFVGKLILLLFTITYVYMYMFRYILTDFIYKKQTDLMKTDI